MCSRVQMAWLTTIERKVRETGKKRDRVGETYPWQCFLFMESILGFDCRLSGTVSEECTTCNRGTPKICFFRRTFRREKLLE